MFRMETTNLEPNSKKAKVLDLLRGHDENKVEKIRNIITKNPKYYISYFDCLLNKFLHDKALSTTEVIANRTMKVIEVLIELGANLYNNNESRNINKEGYDAIHFAALGGNPKLLECIIKHIKKKYPEKINSTTKDGSTALHLLIKKGDLKNPDFIECINVLLKEEDININRTDNKNVSAIYSATSTALALDLLIKEGNFEDPDFIECIKVLFEKNTNININDNRSAIYSAALKNYTKVITNLLKCKNINLDSVINHNKTARDLLKKMGIDIRHIPICILTDREQLIRYLKLRKKTEFIILASDKGIGNEDVINDKGNNNTARDLLIQMHVDVSQITICKLTDQEQLLQYLKTNKETEFLKLASKIGINNENDINEQTYLQYACEFNLLEVVKFLLSQDVDVNKASKENQQSPIEIAAENGYYHIFKLLIEKPLAEVKDTILSVILRNINKYPCDDINYYLCYKYLMNRKNIDVNIKDRFGYYPLRYSTYYNDKEVTLSLLNSKASLGNRNDDGHLTIEDVDYETLNNHLDNCIEESWGIKFDYATLLPTSEMVDEDSNMKQVREDAEQPLNNKVKIFLETEVVRYMSRSPELKSLLKHPVITSFLDIKWHRIRWIFYTNVLFYSTFCLALVLHSIASFNSTNGQDFITYVFLLFMLILLIKRELFQFIIAPRKYIRNVENGIEVLLIIIVIWLLSIRIPFDKTRNQLCASAILLAAFDLLYLLGNHTLLSTKIVMLRRVSLTYFNYFVSYLIPLIAFGLSFHILFNDTGSSSSLSLESNNTKTNQEGKNINSFFVNPLVSIFKTLIMFTGDFETTTLKFKQYPGTSHLIFLIFVITVTVILLNLLNGLAVSDTQIIINEAELVSHTARVEFISYVESLIFSSLLALGFIYRCYYLVSCQKQNKELLVLKTLAKKISLFPIGMDNSTLCIENGKSYFEDSYYDKKSQSFNLDKKCIQKAKNIIREKKEKEKYNKKKEQEKIHIETKEEEGKRRIDDLSNKINEITSVFQKEVVELHNKINEITRVAQEEKEQHKKEKEKEKNHSKEKEEQEKLRIAVLHNKINEITNLLQKEREEHHKEKEEEKKTSKEKEEQEKLRIDVSNNKINEITNLLQKEKEERNKEKEEEKKTRKEMEEQEKLRIDVLNNKINEITNILHSLNNKIK